MTYIFIFSTARTIFCKIVWYRERNTSLNDKFSSKFFLSTINPLLFLKRNACDLNWKTEKRQEVQLIALIYDVREIADGRINEMVPFSSVPMLRGVSCAHCL